jgi:TolB-like protein/tetratricopeptide (TPR) repeat protein
MSFFKELKRRNVFRVGVAYALGAWVLLQIVDFVLEVIQAPEWILQVFFLAAAVGLPIVLIFSWVFEMTPDGIKRESEIDRSQSITPQTRRKLDRVIIATLAIAVALLLLDKFLQGDGQGSLSSPPRSVEAGAGESVSPALNSRSIAVLPFVALSSGADDEYFADGLTEEILNSLAQLPELLVTARTSAFHFKGMDVPVQEIAKKLGVQHIVEGSVRRAGDRLRVTAQLIRANDGFHLWSENYDSTSEDTIAVQEDIAEKIAVAMDVVMNEGKRELMREAGLRDVEAFIAYQKGLELFEKAHDQMDQVEGLRQANTYFELTLERVPGFPPALWNHSDLFVHILLDDATDEARTGVDEQDLAGAFEQAIADFTQGIEHARRDSERKLMEFDLAFVSGDWRGMPARLDSVLREPGCDDGIWLEPMAVVFGYAREMQELAHRLRVCNPLYSSMWVSEARAALWSGDPAAAIEIGREGMQIAPSAWLNMVLINAMVAKGEFELAEKEVNERLQNPEDVLLSKLIIAAARGEKDKLEGLFRQFETIPAHFSGFNRLTTVARMGNREEANRLAAKMDQHPFHNVALTLVTLWCYCGAPFDLSATPNFATSIEQAGLPWPPLRRIEFPLKNW